jgi:hypothetical protein
MPLRRRWLLWTALAGTLTATASAALLSWPLIAAGLPELALALWLALAAHARWRATARAVRCRSRRLTLIAVLLPRAEADDWLRDLDGQFWHAPAADRERILRNVLMHSPGLLWSAWHGWLTVHTRRIWALVTSPVTRRTLARLEQLDVLQRSPAPPWSRNEPHRRSLRARWRGLGRCCRVLRWTVDRRQHPELARRARWLADDCAALLRTAARTDRHPDRGPTSTEAARLLAVTHGTMVLVDQLRRAVAPAQRQNWPSRSSGGDRP